MSRNLLHSLITPQSAFLCMLKFVESRISLVPSCF
jgi:hypothetical protein